MRSNEIEINSLYVRSQSCIVIGYTPKHAHLQPSALYNPLIASYLTAYSRIHLWEFASTYGDSLAYMDTG